MKTSFPLALLLVASLMVGNSNAFTTSAAAKQIRRPSLTPQAVSRSPESDLEDYDLEYALRGDGYGHDDHHAHHLSTVWEHYSESSSQEAAAEDHEPLQDNRELIDTTNSVLRTLYNSFKNVESMANGLLKENPVLALGIFVAGGLVTAYVLGFVILSGSMESWNPVENAGVPYWDEEVLIMTRKIGN